MINSGQCKERHRHQNSKACLGEGRQAGSAGRGSTNKGHRAAGGLFGGSRRFSSTCTILPVLIIFHLFFFFFPHLGSFLPKDAHGANLAAEEAGRAARLPQRCAEDPWPEGSPAATPQQNQELPQLPAPSHGNISRGGQKKPKPAKRRNTDCLYEIGTEREFSIFHFHPQTFQ